MDHTDKIKRSLDEIIDVDQYIVSKGIRRVYKEKLILKEDGTMKLNNTFIRKNSERHFAIAFSNDFREVVVAPNCEPEIRFSKNGFTKDVELVKKWGKKNKPFPLVYDLSWEKDREIWRGRLNMATKE